MGTVCVPVIRVDQVTHHREAKGIEAMETKERKPVHEIRFGLIKAQIWCAKTRAGDRHNVTLTRLFRDGDVWRESNHFGRDDLLLVAKVIDLAHSWIHLCGCSGEAESQ